MKIINSTFLLKVKTNMTPIGCRIFFSLLQSKKNWSLDFFNQFNFEHFGIAYVHHKKFQNWTNNHRIS